MKRLADVIQEKPVWGWALFAGVMMMTFVVGLFATSIIERRAESRYMFQMGKPIDSLEARPAKYQSSFPREYERWKATADSTFKSKYAGSAMRDSLEERPKMVVMWAGYGFSREYNQARGHMHAVEDVRNILRTGVPQPATCWTCKSPDVPRMMAKVGIGEFYRAKWAEMGPEISNPIACLDCHDPKTMDLRISRPALVEAFERRGQDIKNSTHQQMRSLVCAQCHVEYYFKSKEDPYLTFPWDKGTTVEDMIAYYDEKGFKDWEHPISKAPMLKAQHPDWELGLSGIHMQRGLACADCHMPYRSEGGVKFTDHKIISPLANIRGTCQVCHNESEETLRGNVEERHDKIAYLRDKAEDLITRAHFEAKAAWEKGATPEEMKDILTGIRHAQFRWDYTVASIGGAFHAPMESARILGSAIEVASETRRQLTKVLARHGVNEEIAIPDISTKDKAQQVIGLDMVKLRAEKEEFKAKVIPEWDAATKKRESEN
jgi:nitrite reductase (cytochrome c-552)